MLVLLRRLEAYGFKSFAEKTELEFGQGITAIVGPNGSGKSNISDAIRWALGEQSLRTLRGTKLEDVIFVGSANRRPLGVAEVSLVFDNSDGRLPLDFSEVTITRRVFRSGDSEYYINKTPCRLKDIHDILADTGLGRESMTVIGQNKVDEILSSKPEERRLLFEEAAGITKYKQRKREALRKLDDTEQNLIRVRDITSELESQLEPLQESAARTDTFNKLKAELVACQVTVLLERLGKAERLVASATLEQTRLTDGSIAAQTRLTSTETEKESLVLQAAQTDAQIAHTDKEINDIATEIERLDSRHGILSERIEQGCKAKLRLDEAGLRLGTERKAAGEKLAELQSSLDSKHRQLLGIQQEITDKSLRNDQLTASIRQVEQQLATGQEMTFDHLQQLVNERNNLNIQERDLTALAARANKLKTEYANYSQLQDEVNTRKAELQQELQLLAAAQQALKQETAVLRQDIVPLEKRFQAAAAKEQQLLGTVQETTSRINVLTSMQYELEGFGRAIKGILKSRHAWRNGICGAVAQLLSVPDKYVNAIEVALGGAQQHLVTDTEQTAKQAIAFLKAQNLGRATFLPLNTIRLTRPREAELLAAGQPGALGFAADVVAADERYRPVINYLLGRIIIAETIDAALAIARSGGFSFRIVTLDGEIINPGGSLTGGSVARKDASFMARNNEIEVLKQKVAVLQQQRLASEQEKTALERAIAGIHSNIAGLEAKAGEDELRQAELTIYIDKAGSDADRYELELATIRAEMTECEQGISQCRQHITDGQAALALLENRESSHKSQVADWQKELQAVKAEQQAAVEELTDAKIRLSVVNQEIAGTCSACEQYKQTITALDDDLARLQAEENQLQAEIGQARTELGSVAGRKDKLQAAKGRLAEVRQVHYAAKLELLANTQKLDKEIKELRRQSNDLQARLHETELLITKYSYEAAKCSEQITGQMALTLEAARALQKSESIEQLMQMITRMESQITALGPINPAAIDEHRRVQERYDFLQAQSHDLLQAKDYLTAVLKDIDSTMARQFNAAFKAISQYFGEVFVRLFGGGRAELALLEPGNILETGIDIIVQPPGKKLQNLALLSGGERALTVIALLFAILTYRPAPFCVVDEIDAALDEANVQRFSEFLRDYAQSTQFIVVTHRKGTMEAAGVLHGVTMEESGISRLISVKFMDKAG